MRKPTSNEEKVFAKIRGKKAMFHVTKTILEKSIQDANKDIRDLLCETELLDYDLLGNGEKKILKGRFKGRRESNVTITCYKSKTRGDKRIWFKGIKDIAEPNDMMALGIYSSKDNLFKTITIHNLTRG